LTAIEDIGKLVAKSLDLQSWETTSYIVGETLRMDEVVQIAEKAMGKKWEVKTLSPQELELRIESENDAERKLWAQLGLSYARDIEGEGLFPDVSPLTVEGISGSIMVRRDMLRSCLLCLIRLVSQSCWNLRFKRDTSSARSAPI